MSSRRSIAVSAKLANDGRSILRNSKVGLALIAATVGILVFAPSSSAQEWPRVGAVEFLATMREATVDWAKGTNYANCMVVLPSGRFHVERRAQELPNPNATLQIFESILDSAQLQQLKVFLIQIDPKSVPPYQQPTFPIDVSSYYMFRADIKLGDEIQRVGYWSWREGKPGKSPESTPDAVKTRWRKSESALRSLIDWFHIVNNSQTRPLPDAKSTVCSTDAEE